MRLMSFSMTLDQFISGQKDVTRRLGWKFLREGDVVRAVDRVMGLRKGERPQEIGLIRIKSVRFERLDQITGDDVRREGYPGETPEWFVERFCRAMKCQPATEVTRIEFVKIGGLFEPVVFGARVKRFGVDFGTGKDRTVRETRDGESR